MIIFAFLFLFIVSLCIYAVLTDPTSRYTILQKPFDFRYEHGEFLIEKKSSVTVHSHFIWRYFAYFKCAFHIVANVYFGSKKAKGATINDIINNIHKLRFNPQQLYLISGDHFSVQYPRNLGVFYYCMLNKNINTLEEDWRQRQEIYLQTVAYDLEVFSKNKDVTTTIVPTGPNSATCVNIYAYPSDSLYGVLYALNVLLQNRETNRAAKYLLDMYKNDLKDLLNRFMNTVYDSRAGFVKIDIHLSGAKDITMRHSAFYDNVIVWKTLQLSNKLGIKTIANSGLVSYKNKILERYWYGKGGYFLEDISKRSLEKKYYSSDWLVVLFTEFLNPENKEELSYFIRSVEYIQEQNIDTPFGLKYQQTDRTSRQFPLVRIFVPSYGGSSIWSFWGCEYIKLLIVLYRQTGKIHYLDAANKQLSAYKKNIITYNGFPELYDADGKMLSGLFYKSIRQTGWVVNFEQAEFLYSLLRK